MKFFVWKYNPSVVNISKRKNISFIIPSNKEKVYLENGITNIIPVKEISFNYVYEVICEQRQNKIPLDDIFTLDEECMDWVGLLKSIFIPNSNSVSDILFKDKYYMRSVVGNTVTQPKFTELTEDKIEKITTKDGLVKPRRADSAKGIYHFKNKINSKKLANSFNYISSNDFLVEEFVDYDKMFTVDGYTDFKDNERFFSHEYNSKVSEYKENKYLTIHTSSLYYNDLDKLKRLFKLSKEVLTQLCPMKGIVPFHIEWFYSTKNDKFIFTEAGKRFGGAKIPELIKESFGIDVLSEYWTIQEGGKINTEKLNEEYLYPEICSTTYMQFQNGLKMNKELKSQIPNLKGYSQYVPIGQTSKVANSISDTFFSAQFCSKSVEESDFISKKINYLFDEVSE